MGSGATPYWIFKVTCVINSNSWFLAILNGLSEDLPLFKLMFFVLKLKIVLTKIDISRVKS